ncbi:MAG: translocation/assembly module TamB domain-containing protein, partial [Parachlamydiaceae bacterium]
SLPKLLFGVLSSAIIDLEDLKILSVKMPLPLPSHLRVLLSWNPEMTEFEGQLEPSKSDEDEFPYSLLGQSRFRMTLPKHGEKKLPTFTSIFSKLQIQEYTFESVAMNGTWDPIHSHADVSLTAKEVAGNGISLSNPSLAFFNRQGHLSEWAYELSTEGIYKEPFLAHLKGSFSNDSSTRSLLQIKHGDAIVGEHVISLKKPLKVVLLENARLEIPYGHVSIDGKDVFVAGSGAQDAMEFTLTLPKQAFSFNVPQNEAISPLTGNMAASVFLQGPLFDLQGKMELHLDSIAVKHPISDKKFMFKTDLFGSLLTNEMNVKGAFYGHEIKLFEIDGTLPIDRQGSFPIMFSRNQQMALHVSGKLDIAHYIHHLISTNLWLTGQTAFAFDIGGSIDYPSLKGLVKLKEGTFERWESGTLFKNIYAELAVTQDKVRLQTLQGHSLKGKVTGTGELDLNPSQYFPFHVDLQLDQSTLVDLDTVQIDVSGNATFSGNTQGALVKGDLATDLIDILLTEESSAIKHNIQVAYVNQSKHEAAPTQIMKSEATWPICYDLHVKNRGGVLIHGKELKSEWKGDIHVKGCNDGPLLYGELRVTNGNYLFDGKKFRISEGTISFAGELNKKTTLYVVGEMEIGPILAQVVVKGPMNDPSLLFRSTPSLSQREILSWIIFGRGMGDITAFQGAELTQSLSKLKEAGKEGPSFFSRLKEALPLDRIGISGEGGAEDLSLQVGKYLTPEIFLGVKRNMTTEVNRIGIEANLMKNVKIEAEVGDDTEGCLHLKWKHDY